ncbi:hypothetical protein LJ737_25420 [Hymenobacter sp. 15J16-1T3B]|uniref:hypothetical protein n=1 Tax=Hymenobacter sp. 15J16-1T3B TaxID=2886941 RepID=UPI001D106E1A|nr:hypothetical protein [Hymenobacter sp. 15J16-1T3B]MCC3160603.1 hypothetical protein [Hymenobacter sp. 15J16-1T3B]
MNYLPLLTSLLAALTALAGCEKNTVGPEASLPPATATGAETLGFVLDGAAWTPAGQRCGIYGCADNRVEASSHLSGRRRFLLLTAARTDGRRNESFVLQIDSLAGPGVYRATAGGPGATGAEAGTKLYYTDSRRGMQYQSRPGTATITVTAVDTVRNLVAGTFEGKLSSLGADESAVQISAGRFDVFYNR